MINLVFDLSNMFFRSMFIVGGYGSKNYTFDNQYEIDQLMRKVSTDISYIIRQVNPSRVILTLDSKSWRKDLSIDENEGYKGNREKNENINWDNVYNTMEEFGDILASNGIIVSKIDRAEADDLMALWRDEILFNQNQHIIIVSSDEDVRQLVHFFPYDDNKIAFSTVFNPFATGKKASKKFFVPSNFEDWINTEEEGDIFNRAIDVDKEDFIRFRGGDKITQEVVNGNEIALKKIFCGDDGDNIPAIYSWIAKDDQGNVKINSKTGEPRVDRITNSKYEKIVESLSIKDYLDLGEKADLIYQHIQKYSKEEPSIDIIERLKRQIKLVVLSRDEFPKEIVEAFDKTVEKEMNKPYISSQQLNMNSILEGTRYVKAKSTENEASIFKDLDHLTTKGLF